ncbi:MAG: TonB-dependent siderophore receptor [Ramlibacter sp.]
MTVFQPHRTAVVLAVLGLAGALAQSAAAQSAASAEAAAPAQPVPENGSAVSVQVDNDGLPLTKHVVGRKQIEEGAEQEGYGEAVKNVPGAMSNNGKGSANDAIRFRGLQLGLYSNYRLNGGLAITNVITIPTENKEKVEALKGANALMFGLASPAGILNLVTKRATDKPVTTLTLSGNAFGQYGAAVDIGRKFGAENQFGLRINASGTHIETGVHDIGGTGEFFSVAADWRVMPQLVLKADYERYSKDVVEQANVTPPTAVNNVIVVPKPPDPRLLASGPWDVYRPRTENMVLRAEYQLGSRWDLLAEGGESKSHRERTQGRILLTNVATGDGRENITFIKNQQYDNTYGKAEAHGRLDTWMFHHDLTLGYSMAQRDSNIPSTYNPPSTSNNLPTNIYNPVTLAPPVDPQTALAYSPNRSRDAGTYVYDMLSFAEKWKLLFGVRKTDYTFSQTKVPNGPQTTTQFKPTAKGIGLLYDVAPRTMLYTSYMQAMEDGPIAPSGPIQGRTVTNAFAVLEPAISTQKEVGIRSSYFDGTFFNLDYFDIVKANTNLIPNGATTYAFQYDGDLHLRGFEFTGNKDLTKRWSISGSAQLMKATQQGGANDGKSTENTPDSIVSANLAYRAAWKPGLTLRAGASYVSSRFIGNSEQGSIPAVTLFSAGFSYVTSIAGHKTAFQLGIDNLANKRYWASATSSALGPGMDRAIRFSAKTEL